MYHGRTYRLDTVYTVYSTRCAHIASAIETADVLVYQDRTMSLNDGVNATGTV